jgi:hypothetical protein
MIVKKVLSTIFVLLLLLNFACAGKKEHAKILWGIDKSGLNSYDIIDTDYQSSKKTKFLVDNKLDLSKKCEPRTGILRLKRFEDNNIYCTMELRNFKIKDKIWAVELIFPDFGIKKYINYDFYENDKRITFNIKLPSIYTVLPEDSQINIKWNLFYLRHYDNINGMGIKKELRWLKITTTYTASSHKCNIIREDKKAIPDLSKDKVQALFCDLNKLDSNKLLDLKKKLNAEFISSLTDDTHKYYFESAKKILNYLVIEKDINR